MQPKIPSQKTIAHAWHLSSKPFAYATCLKNLARMQLITKYKTTAPPKTYRLYIMDYFLLLIIRFMPQYPSYHISVGVPVTIEGSAFMVWLKISSLMVVSPISMVRNEVTL